MRIKLHQFRWVSSCLHLSLLRTMYVWWDRHARKLWQLKAPLFLFVRWGYAGHKRLSDAIALLPSSSVASKHCRHMAHRSTLDLSTPKNLCASSLGKTWEGLDWLGTLSMQEIKFNRSSVRQTSLMIKSIWSYFKQTQNCWNVFSTISACKLFPFQEANCINFQCKYPVLFILWNGNCMLLFVTFQHCKLCIHIALHVRTFTQIHFISWHLCIKWWVRWAPQSICWGILLQLACQ